MDAIVLMYYIYILYKCYYAIFSGYKTIITETYYN